MPLARTRQCGKQIVAKNHCDAGGYGRTSVGQNEDYTMQSLKAKLIMHAAAGVTALAGKTAGKCSK